MPEKYGENGTDRQKSIAVARSFFLFIAEIWQPSKLSKRELKGSPNPKKT